MNCNFRFFSIIAVFILFHFQVIGQTINLDSLHNELQLCETDTQKIIIYLQLSDSYINTDLVQSTKLAYNALELASQLKDNQKSFKIYSNLGISVFKQGNINRAFAFFTEASNYISPTDSVSKIANLINVGGIYYAKNNLDSAAYLYTKAIDFIDKIHKTKQLMDFKNSALVNLGNIYEVRSENDKAIEYYNMVILNSNQIASNKHLDIAYQNLGKLYLKLNDTIHAKKCIEQALQIREATNNKYGLISTFLLLSNYYYFIGNSKHSLEYLFKTNQLAHEVNHWFYISSTSLDIYKGYIEAKDWENALKYYTIYKQYSDSLLIQNNEIEFIRLETEDKIKKINAENQAKLKYHKYATVIIVISLFAVISFLMLLYYIALNRQKKIMLLNKKNEIENERLKTNLEIRNKELTSNILQLITKSETIKDVTQKLTNFKTTAKNADNAFINQIIAELNQATDENAWQEFEKRFCDVHTNFYINLQNNFPDLTPNEKRLCALLRLNMNTKDISALTKLSANSIDVARARLRKKLNINNTDINLNNFLQNY